MSAAYSMKAASCEPFAAAHEQAEAMERHLRSADAMAQTDSELETYIEREGREYERRLLQAHLELRAAQERPVVLEAADGVRRTQVPSAGCLRFNARCSTSSINRVAFREKLKVQELQEDLDAWRKYNEQRPHQRALVLRENALEPHLTGTMLPMPLLPASLRPYVAGDPIT